LIISVASFADFSPDEAHQSVDCQDVRLGNMDTFVLLSVGIDRVLRHEIYVAWRTKIG
jgi:hypothetical protein